MGHHHRVLLVAALGSVLAVPGAGCGASEARSRDADPAGSGIAGAASAGATGTGGAGSGTAGQASGGSGVAGSDAGAAGASGVAGASGEAGEAGAKAAASGAGGLAGVGGDTSAAGAGTNAGTGGVGGGSAGTGGAGASAGAGDAGAGGSTKKTCDAPRFGSPMVEIPSSLGGAYCMDARPPTQKEYQTFVQAKNGDMSGQSKRCEKHASFDIPVQQGTEPELNTCPKYAYTPDVTPTLPVKCVTFCDAEAFCAWAGKRLCGREGGGPYPIAESQKGIASEWANACTQGGKYPYPAGDKPTPASEITVPWKPQKDGVFAAFEDLGGPFSEWMSSCDFGWLPNQSPNHEACALGGGGDMPCVAENWAGMDWRSEHLSFRCCAE